MQGVSVVANDTAMAVQDQLLQTEEIQKKVDVVNDANEQIVDSMQQTLSVLKDGNQDSDAIKALVKVLKSDDIKKFIDEKYDGAVIAFE